MMPTKTSGPLPILGAGRRTGTPALRVALFLLLAMSSAVLGCGDDGVDTGSQVIDEPSSATDGGRTSDRDSLPSDPAEASADPAEASADPSGESGAETVQGLGDEPTGSGPADGSPGDDAGGDPTANGPADGSPGDDAGGDFMGNEPDAGSAGDDDMDADDGRGETPAAPLRIVPIGDSITQGRLGDGTFDSSSGSTLSYRYALWKLFVDAGIELDFVGSQTGGFGGDPAWEDYRGLPFDREHEGHWGWTLDAIRDSLESSNEDYEADVALIMLGTNDVDAGDDVSEMLLEAADIIAILRQARPDIVIIWGHAYQEWDPFPEFRDAMEGLATELSTPTSPIITVNHAEGWISDPSDPASHTVDGVHPNLRGDQKLAEAFFEALQDWL